MLLLILLNNTIFLQHCLRLLPNFELLLCLTLPAAILFNLIG
jgi:hypothetical protein